MLSKKPTNLPPHFKFIKQYLGSGDLARARQLFDQIPEPDVHSWTILMSAYTQNGRPDEAIKLYEDTKRNLGPDRFALLAVAKACANSGNVEKAKGTHSDAVKYRISSDLLLGNALIDMFGKCKYVEGAETVFEGLEEKDVVSWTSFCSCYVNCGLPREALRAFRDMGLSGIRPNAMTLSSVLPACSDLKCLSLGREIHSFGVRNGMGGNVFVNSALVDMYSSCSRIRDAELVFRYMPQLDVVSWNVIISAYFRHSECGKALDEFHRMRSRGVKLSIASWNSVISGCIDNGKSREALELFGQMQQLGFKPNQITITSMLAASTHLENWRAGKEIHAYAVKHSFMNYVAANTALVLMYAKSGDVELSLRVFRMMQHKDTVAWNTIMIACSMHGRGEQALSLFSQMTGSGVQPNSVTFTGVLSGCSHSQLVDEGLSIFYTMRKDYKIEPDAEHYSCIVDALARAGRLSEAYNFINQMPVEPTASAWGALLGACRVHKNVDLGRIAATQLFMIEPNNPGNYVLLFNILVTAKLWGEASETRKMMRDRGIRKVPGCSWVVVKKTVHTFVAGDKNNDRSNEIFNFLDEVRRKMKIAGLNPVTEFVLQDLDGVEVEDSLCNHSEKLAVAFGILNLQGESSIKVFKNLRICGDCHNTIKFIAKDVGVQIIVRDSLRFHHFKNGLCSCKEFW